jgi:hypothetical protein
MTPDEAKQYGVIDEIITPHRGLCAPPAGAADAADRAGTDAAGEERALSGAHA